MKYLVDTCGWIEWLTNGKLAQRFAIYFRDLSRLITPTLIQFELYRWVEREKGDELALEIVGLTEQTNIILLDTRIALHAAELSKQHNLAMADAIIYASARSHEVDLITMDKHFKSLEGVKYYAA